MSAIREGAQLPRILSFVSCIFHHGPYSYPTMIHDNLPKSINDLAARMQNIRDSL